VLGTVFGYLKLDTLTRGYYTHRLQFAAAGLILATAGAAASWYAVVPRVSVRTDTLDVPPATRPSHAVPADMEIKLTESPAG
jgi:hypothetical protein